MVIGLLSLFAILLYIKIRLSILLHEKQYHSSNHNLLKKNNIESKIESEIPLVPSVEKINTNNINITDVDLKIQELNHKKWIYLNHHMNPPLA